MLVTIGQHRFNLINITNVVAHIRSVYFVDGTTIEMNDADFAAFTAFWDSHGEIINPATPAESDNDAAREFVIGETPPPANPTG